MNAPLRSRPLPAPIARRLAAPIAALAALAVLVGCSAGASGPSGAVDAEPAPYSAEVDQGAVDGAAPEQADGSSAVDADRVVVVNSTVGMRSPDVEAAVADVEAAALGAQGYVEARDIRTGATRPTANVTMRVPADRHDAMIDELREIGDVTTVTTSAQDVTLATIDIAARIESLESSISSLRGMLERATEVEDMLRVEQELSTREGEMLSLQQQLDWLEDQAAMSTIAVSITATSDTVVDPDDDLPGFGTGLATGWNDLVRFFTGAVAVLGYMIPG
ncbi:MAG: DUF4349 domain-containing protein, partial [Microbacteriaceae bacterium]|nr:DUF4349 domain-containing protein [Microbacteriaceae bacterium]